MGQKLSGEFVFCFINDCAELLAAHRKYQIEAGDLIEGRERCREMAEADPTLVRRNCVMCNHIAWRDPRGTWRKVIMQDSDDNAGTSVESLF